MHVHFCTLTDKNYVPKWLALYDSIAIHVSHSTVWVLCLDTESVELIRALQKPNIRIVQVTDLHLPALEATRPTRTKGEFAWTCKPAIIAYVLSQPETNAVIFADSDILFYSSPLPLYEKYSNASILITSHRFPKDKEHLADEVGYYNSGFIVFRNTDVTRACIAVWQTQCIDWCYNYHDNGRHGDQSYLKTWPTKFSGVLEIEDKGVNTGPWNIERYSVSQDTTGHLLVDNDPLVCYHFHAFRIYLYRAQNIRVYPVSRHNAAIDEVYLVALRRAYATIRITMPSWKYGFGPRISLLRVAKQHIFRFFGI